MNGSIIIHTNSNQIFYSERFQTRKHLLEFFAMNGDIQSMRVFQHAYEYSTVPQ